LLYYGNEEGLEKGAAIGGLVEGGVGLAGMAKNAAVYAYFNNPYKYRVVPLLSVGPALPLPTVVRTTRSALEMRARFLQYKLYTSGELTFFEATRTTAISLVEIPEGIIVTHTSEAAWQAMESGRIHLRPAEMLGPPPANIPGIFTGHAEMIGVEFASHFSPTGVVATYPRGCVVCVPQLRFDYPGYVHLNPKVK
jgi:hypothetical protein